MHIYAVLGLFAYGLFAYGKIDFFYIMQFLMLIPKNQTSSIWKLACFWDISYSLKDQIVPKICSRIWFFSGGRAPPPHTPPFSFFPGAAAPGPPPFIIGSVYPRSNRHGYLGSETFFHRRKGHRPTGRSPFMHMSHKLSVGSGSLCF